MSSCDGEIKTSVSSDNVGLWLELRTQLASLGSKVVHQNFVRRRGKFDGVHQGGGERQVNRVVDSEFVGLGKDTIELDGLAQSNVDPVLRQVTSTGGDLKTKVRLDAVLRLRGNVGTVLWEDEA